MRGVHLTYKAGPQDEMTIQSYFHTNNEEAFRSFKSEAPNSSQLQEFRDRLSQSSFHLGNSPMKYSTTTKDSHIGSASLAKYSILERKQLAIQNNVTNFASHNQDEKQVSRFAIPTKPQVSPEAVQDFVKDMKTLHVHVGSGHQD